MAILFGNRHKFSSDFLASGLQKNSNGRVTKKRKKIIKDPKLRGEWVESLFVARAGEEGLAVSQPWGDSKTFDFVVGRPGRFVGVQVKSTTVIMNGGYMCTVKRNNKAYARGSFDFVAAYVIPEEVWYIVPAEKLHKRETMILCSESKQAQYEQYREAWHLLREASGSGLESEDPPLAKPGRSEPGSEDTSAAESDTRFPGNALGRMEASLNFFRRQLERGRVVSEKDDDV
jgi:hypothetical protein